MKKRVTGIGGVFFKSKDPVQLKAWYKKHLGMNTDEYGVLFAYRDEDDPQTKGFLQWTPFKEDTNDFSPSTKQFMINYRVENLVELIKVLKEEGIDFLDEMATYDYGKFIHLMDPEGNKIELWEPTANGF